MTRHIVDANDKSMTLMENAGLGQLARRSPKTGNREMHKDHEDVF